MTNKIYIKITVLTVVLAMVFTTAVGAVTFTDISNHWAKDYIQKVAENGLVAGYENGTFKPEANVTVLESLVMLSRLYKIDDDIKEQIISNYEPVIEDMNNAYDYKWAFEGLSIALELGIVSESGLRNMFSEKTISKAASKEEISILLTKAMLLGEEAKNLKVYTLPFKDVSDISTAARPYIYVMYDKGIVQGDTQKNINPKSNITRAVIATMIDRAYTYISDNDVTPDFEKYVGKLTKIKGTITEITEGNGESTVKVTDEAGETSVVRVNKNTKVYLNDKLSTISKIEEDTLVECSVDEDRIARTFNVDSLTKTIKGTISSVAYVSPAKITILNEKNKKVVYDIPSEGVKIYLDGKEVPLKDLEEKDSIVLKVRDGIVQQIDSTSRIQKYAGKITSIDYNKLPIKITVLVNGKSMVFEYYMDVEVTRNDKKSSFDRVNVGDSVTITTEYGEMIKLNTEAAEAELSGTIKEIVLGTKNKIKISVTGGDEEEYVLSSNVKINLGDKNGTINDLRVGYYISVNTSGNEIVTIEAEEIQTAKNFSGKVIYINSDDKLIMLQNTREDGQSEMIYIRITNSTNIINLEGKTKYFKDIAEGSRIMGYATYQVGEYVAVSVIIQ